MSTTSRKITASLVAFAAAGAMAFGGTALADGNNDRNHVGGPGGPGGEANANCLIPIGLSIGLLGQGGDVAQCNAAGGQGGAGGTGADY
jgi:hypothetical protein